jgi:hypothetical protein
MYYISKYTYTLLQAPSSVCVCVVNTFCGLAYAFPLVAILFNTSSHNNLYHNYGLEVAIRV